jgi:hypothetical protein
VFARRIGLHQFVEGLFQPAEQRDPDGPSGSDS